MRELLFVLDALRTLIVGAFLLRVLFQIARADFRNPLVQAIARLTNPVILPLRRVLPSIGRVDTASLVAVLVAQVICTGLFYALSGGAVPGVPLLLMTALIQLLDTALTVYLFAVLVYVLLSWVSTDGYSPLGRALHDLCEPVLAPFRRAVPSLGGLDVSPAIVLIVIYLLRMILNDRIAPALLGRL